MADDHREPACDHDGVDVEAYAVNGEQRLRVLHAAPKAAFDPGIFADHGPDLVVDGDRVTIGGTVVYEVTDWHHRCPGWGGREFALATLVSRII